MKVLLKSEYPTIESINKRYTFCELVDDGDSWIIFETDVDFFSWVNEE